MASDGPARPTPDASAWRSSVTWCYLPPTRSAAGERGRSSLAGNVSREPLVGASLWPVGDASSAWCKFTTTCRAAVDYLISRSDVDPAKLAITGASGGGNQTLYAGATDDRSAVAVIPVCGIGTYDSYLTDRLLRDGEVNAGGGTYATTGDLLAMIAPRALLVVSATRDALQFSVGEAAKSVAHARERFRLLRQEPKIRHVSIESDHDYNKAMREAMYKRLGCRNGSAARTGRRRTWCLELELKLEEVDGAQMFPGRYSRPRPLLTIPESGPSAGRIISTGGSAEAARSRRSAWDRGSRADANRFARSGLGRVSQEDPPTQIEKAVNANPEKVVLSITPERHIQSKGFFEGTNGQSGGTALLIWEGPDGNAGARALLDESKRKCCKQPVSRNP